MESSSHQTVASVPQHADAKIFGRPPLLFVGTDLGLIAWNSTDGTETIGLPWWIFDRSNAEEFVNQDILDWSRTSSVNTIFVEESEQGSDDVWFGMGGGLHLVTMDLIISQPKQAFDSERMLNLEGLLSGANDIHSILPLDGMVVLGSRDGTWCLEGGSNGILGEFQNQTEIPGLVTSMDTLEVDGEFELAFGTMRNV